ncbi:hypothetical protein ACNQFZ_11335 [Schinkia sp. CFF1]
MYFNEIEGSNASLPWMKFYLNLGRYFLECIWDSNRKYGICINVPFTEYLAVTIGLGVCDAIYSEDVEIKETEAEYEIGMLLFYKVTPDHDEKAVTFQGFNSNGHPIVKTKGKNPETITITHNWENKLRIAPTQRSYKRNRYLSNDHTKKVKQFYGTEVLNRLEKSNEFSLLFIGNETRLKKEFETRLTENLFFSDFLLPKQLVGEQEYYLSELVSSRHKEDLHNIKNKTIVIYNTLEAFNNFYEELVDCHCILLFDRRDTSIHREDVFNLLKKLSWDIDKGIIEETKKLPGDFFDGELIAWSYENE